MHQRGKVIAAFVGVFVAGAVCGGGLALRLASVPVPPAAPSVSLPEHPAPPPPAVPFASSPVRSDATSIHPQMLRQFTQRLKLTPPQWEKIRPILARTSAELDRLRRENLQETTRTVERMYAEVAPSLTPAQVIELEKIQRKMLERVAEERRKRGDQPPPSPHPTS